VSSLLTAHQHNIGHSVPQTVKSICSATKDVLFLALDWQCTGQCLFRLWHTASLYCRHVTSG